MDGSAPVEVPCVARVVEAQRIRISAIVVNREPRPFNDLYQTRSKLTHRRNMLW